MESLTRRKEIHLRIIGDNVLVWKAQQISSQEIWFKHGSHGFNTVHELRYEYWSFWALITSKIKGNVKFNDFSFSLTFKH